MPGLTVALHALPYLLRATITTIWVSLAGIVLGQVLGLLVCAARRSERRVLRAAAAGYVSVFRGVPLLVELQLIYLLLPFVGIDVPALLAAVLGLGLASGAYVSEIFRGALQAIPPGQAEAALSLGWTRRAIWRRVLLPQMLRLSLPSLVNELILLLKASSLIYVIGVSELTRASQSVAATTYRPLQIFGVAAVIYLALNVPLAALGARLERRLARG